MVIYFYIPPIILFLFQIFRMLFSDRAIFYLDVEYPLEQYSNKTNFVAVVDLSYTDGERKRVYEESSQILEFEAYCEYISWANAKLSALS